MLDMRHFIQVFPLWTSQTSQRNVLFFIVCLLLTLCFSSNFYNFLGNKYTYYTFCLRSLKHFPHTHISRMCASLVLIVIFSICRPLVLKMCDICTSVLRWHLKRSNAFEANGNCKDFSNANFVRFSHLWLKVALEEKQY